jgi:hypothetical protein
MKRRVRKIANFFAFNLLFFALYLNFIHKDKSGIQGVATVQPATPAFSGTVLVDNPTPVQNAQGSTAAAGSQKAEPATALKLSIN